MSDLELNALKGAMYNGAQRGFETGLAVLSYLRMEGVFSEEEAKSKAISLGIYNMILDGYDLRAEYLSMCPELGLMNKTKYNG